MTKYIYCKVCDKEIDYAVRKPMETFQKVIWVIVIIATVGLAGIVFAFYYMNKKKVHCPTCRAKVEFSRKPHKKLEEETEEKEPLTTKERVLKKAGKKMEAKKRTEEEEEEEEGAPPETTDKKKDDQTFCPYCGEDIKPDAVKCPYCFSSLKTPY